jgi:hypothetical protein
MAETEAEKQQRILRSERRHDVAEPPPVALRTVAPLLGGDIEAPFKVLLAHPSKWFQPRGQDPTSVVVHCNGTGFPAASTAGFFHSSVDSGSAQAAADGVEGYTCVPDDAVCAGAPPLNQEGLHIEQPGRTDWSRDEWLRHDAQLRRVAFHVAGWCKKYGIPVFLARTEDLVRLGEKGKFITCHGWVSEAFDQSTHTDPMPNFPWDVWMGYVRDYFDGGDEMTPEEKAQLNEALTKAREADEFRAGVNDKRTGKQEPPEGPRRNGWRFADEAFSRPASGAPGPVKDHKHTPGGIQP